MPIKEVSKEAHCFPQHFTNAVRQARSTSARKEPPLSARNLARLENVLPESLGGVHFRFRPDLFRPRRGRLVRLVGLATWMFYSSCVRCARCSLPSERTLSLSPASCCQCEAFVQRPPTAAGASKSEHLRPTHPLFSRACPVAGYG